ncbi:MAG: tRNA pseudouridine(13) synthase TruD [Deltaproteobacteria bacterium]|nr:tRNA pseudouridine(13) synthase TruD [Deltaproteobacteria bacterium]
MARFDSSPETFRVQEVPSYEPSGTGTHVYVLIEKRGLTTPEAIRALCTAVGVDPKDVGYAGMKDKHATTTQWLSFPEAAEAKLADVNIDKLRVISRSRHGNKLRVGHVRKNLFEVTLTDVSLEEQATLCDRFAALTEQGVANRYGQQRFGRGDNVATGLAILQGTRREKDRRKRTLLISAVQSAVFNQVLAWRQEQGSLRRVLGGDVLQKRETGGLFTSSDEVTDQGRLLAGELVTTGPLPGAKAPRPSEGSAADLLEQAAMAAVGLTPELMAANARDLPGARRPLLMAVQASAPPVARGSELHLAFALPSGAYATVVIDSLLGTSPAAPT